MADTILVTVDDSQEAVSLVINPDGDMLKSVYDPTSVSGDAFDMDNMVEGTAKILTTAERAAIVANTAKVGVTTEEANTINSEVEAGMTGEDLVLNVLSLTTAEYGAGTPIATTLYIITDAT